ncbi:unnamed protein product [Mesocestoides corti]|nr:unnamed protein product [Mesocestoides corti]
MWELCLQSHLEQQPLTPYLTALWLHTISQSIKSEKYFERSEVDEADTEVVDDGDIDYRSVPYLRNPNYDGWFDIDRPRLQLGHCALAVASAIERQALVLFSDTLILDLKEVAPSLSLLGFALVEDANRLLTFAKTVSESSGLSNCIDQEVLSAVERLIESSDRRSDDSEVKRGEPTLLTESDVNLTLKTFKELVAKFPPTKKSFHDTVASLVSIISKDAEILKAEQARVHELYTSFETTREEIWRTEVERMRRREVLSSVKSRLRELADEEERLTYFDHTKEIEHKAWLAPRTRKERSWSRMKEWKKDLRNYQQKRQGGREAVENV